MDLVVFASLYHLLDNTTCDDRLKEHPVTVLRDIGRNGVVVRKDLIRDLIFS